MGGYSYQELAQQLEIVAEKVDFVLKSLPVKMKTSITDANGAPQTVVVSLYDIYKNRAQLERMSEEIEDNVEETPPDAPSTVSPD